MGFGKRLQTLLKERGMTVTELANEVDIPRTTIYSIIRRDSEPEFETVLHIASALDVDFDVLTSIPDEDFSMEKIEARKRKNLKMATLLKEHKYDELAELLGLPEGSIIGSGVGDPKPKRRLSMYEESLLNVFNSLNDEGKSEALKRISELAELKRYKE